MGSSAPRRSATAVATRVVLGPCRLAVGIAANALGKLDSALNQPDQTARTAGTSVINSEDFDGMLRAVQDAHLRVDKRDPGLAERLRAVEAHLLEQRTRARGDVLLPLQLDRSLGEARLQEIRRQLMAATPRPEDTDDEE